MKSKYYQYRIRKITMLDGSFTYKVDCRTIKKWPKWIRILLYPFAMLMDTSFVSLKHLQQNKSHILLIEELFPPWRLFTNVFNTKQGAMNFIETEIAKDNDHYWKQLGQQKATTVAKTEIFE